MYEPPPTSHDPADAIPPLALGVAGDRDVAPVEGTHGEVAVLSNPDEASPPERFPESAMIDIHPAHHAATTWREFFIHIATIVLGLIIAVGLEQTVEYFHHRQQLAEARRALAVERRVNIIYFAAQTAEFHRMAAQLQDNIAILQYLQAHPHAAPETWPARFNLSSINYGYRDAAWHTADHVLEMMPGPEREADANLYRRLASLQDAVRDERTATTEIRNCFILYPGMQELSPAQIDHLIDLTAKALAKYGAAAGMQRNLNSQYPDFKPAPVLADENKLIHYKGDPEVTARGLSTLARVNAEAEAAGEDQQ